MGQIRANQQEISICKMGEVTADLPLSASAIDVYQLNFWVVMPASVRIAFGLIKGEVGKGVAKIRSDRFKRRFLLHGSVQFLHKGIGPI